MFAFPSQILSLDIFRQGLIYGIEIEILVISYETLLQTKLVTEDLCIVADISLWREED